MKIINKVLITLILVITIFLVKPQCIFCDSSELYDADSDKTFLSSLDKYKTSGEDSESVKTIVNNILSLLIAIGVVLATVFIAILGFQNVLGSAEEKAVNHEQMMTLVVGSIILFAGSAIVKILYNVATSW